MIGVWEKPVTESGFGSALATGSAIASSVYLASQSWWGALWVQIAGIPTWVTLSGALNWSCRGLAVGTALCPLGEWLVNRWRGERYLEGIIDRIETNFTANPSRWGGLRYSTGWAGTVCAGFVGVIALFSLVCVSTCSAFCDTELVFFAAFCL